MNADDKRLLLAEQLEHFRKLTYQQLVHEMQRADAAHDCLHHTEGAFEDGTVYQVELNAFWDDKSGGDVRVDGDITTEPQRPWLGFIPVYSPDASDGFIMAPDGTFVGE